MPVYSYIALDQQGRETRGKVEANNAREAGTNLRNSAIYVVSLREGDSDPAGGDGRSWREYLSVVAPGQYMPVKTGDLIFLFRQLGLMLNAGHTVVQALEANAQMSVKRKLRRALQAMAEDIQNGGSLSRAVARQKDVFPPITARLLESGEQSGEIDLILERLADDMDRRQDVKRQLVTALTYPMIVLFMAIGVSVALVGWVIPRFARFLTSRDVDLPPITQFLLDVSDWFQDWGGIVGGTSMVLVFGTLVAYTTVRGKTVIDGGLLRLPVINKVITASNLAQASWTLSMQLRSGITLLQGLRITRDVLPNRALANAFGDASEQILGGRSLSQSLKHRFIPHLVRHMAAIGERSGDLDGVMATLGEHYRKDLQGRVKTLAAWVEPLLIILVGGMVAVVYLAFFQAALKVSSGGM